MKKEHKEIAEKIIDELKKSKNGIISKTSMSRFSNDRLVLSSITKSLLEDFKIINEYGKHNFRINDKGWNFTSFSDLEKELVDVKKKSDIEFKKSVIDLELAEKMLKEYPKTKWFARIGFIIAVVLVLKELIEWIIQLQSQ